MKQTFAIDSRNNDLTAADLLSVVRTMYPDVEDPDEYAGPPYPHPVNATTVVLMSAVTLDTTDVAKLVQFTGYSHPFISAIRVNMENSRLWSDGRYDASAWLSSTGTIDDDRLFDDVDVAIGICWTPDADSGHAADPCGIYWDERGGLRRTSWSKQTGSGRS